MSVAKTYDTEKLFSQFHVEGEFKNAEPYGNGHINDTYAVTCLRDGTPHRYILQRLNHQVFTKPVELMENARRICDELMLRLRESQVEKAYRRALTIYPTKKGDSFYKDDQGNYWRVYLFIEDVIGYDIVENEEQAFQAARAFGEFQKLLTNLPGERLHETIPGFHDTPRRFRKFKHLVESDPLNRVTSAQAVIDDYLSYGNVVARLLDLFDQGLIPERVTHNDTKLNNVLIDKYTQEALCVIDLDTCMPGLVPYDFGDLMRTSTSSVAEDETDLSKIVVQPELFKALVRGYLSSAVDFLTPSERENLVFGGILMTLEVGMRFLTDYLEGDVYFKTKYEDHNLVRSRTQMALVKALEEYQHEFETFVNEEYERITKK